MKKIIAAAVSAALTAAVLPIPALAVDETCVYEAESAYTGGWAVRIDDSSASAGALVTHVGGTNTDIGTVVFNVWADSTGTYDCTVSYRSREDSSFYIRVNYDGWDPANDTKVSTSAGDSITDTKQRIKLNKGWNRVKIYSLEGIEKSGGAITKDKRIDIDKLTVNTAGKTIDGIIEDTASGRGESRRAYMAEDQSVTKNAEFDVNAEKDGAYDLNIWYSTADFRAMSIYVDGNLADTIYCPITGEDYNIETVSAKLSLSEGTHHIALTNEYSEAPEIDKIQLTEAEDRSGSNSSGIQEFSNSEVSVRYDMASGKADFISGGTTRVKGFEAAVKVEGMADTGNGDRINSVVKSSDYTDRTVEESILSTGYGLGKRYDVISTAEGLPELRQSFYIYNGLNYILTSVEISSPDGVSTNFLAPIAAAGADVVDIGAKTDARSLCVPFANDNYTTYDPQTLNGNHTSYWVTCLFDNASRNAVVAGSVDHDTWKTGTSTFGTADNGSVSFFGAFAGIWSREQTYDFLPHGSVDGTTVESPKMFLGYFDDWRDGMEVYGEANNKNQPLLHWGGGNIFGYSSWNAYGSNVSLDTMKTASDVIDGLETFHDENGIQWINIDSYWDNLTQNNDESQLKEYIAYCKAKGQKVGMYTARFICWDDDLWNWGKRGYAITDQYGNAVAPAKPDANNITTIDCFAFDPTSAEAKQDTKYWMEHWKELGFEFLKVDFMNFAAVEGVYQDKSVKTGLQAYSQACEQILQYVDPDKFFINYSIAPLFPYQYAHSRRLSCDVWTEKGNLDAAKYMLNALTYSWWQSGTVYEFADPDQISMDVRMLIGGNEDQARAKYTSGVIAGMMVLSNKYEDALGTAKNVTKKVAQNEEVNKIARLGRSFRPMDATGPCPSRDASDPADTFTLTTDDAFYLAVFNYGDSKTSKTIDLARAGLEPGKKYTFTELWTNTAAEAENTLDTGNMPAYSCKLYKAALDNGGSEGEKIEIESARILNEDNSPVIYGGDVIHSSVSVTNGAAAEVMMGYSDNNGKTYNVLDEGGTVPQDADRLMIAVTASKNDSKVVKTYYVNVGKDDNTIESIDFSNGAQIREWALSGTNGWSSGGGSDTQVQAMEEHGGSMRVANSTFFQNSWVEHSFTYAEKERLIAEGAGAADAEAEAAENLSNNVEVSFDTMLDNRAGNDKSENYAHIRIYDNNGKVIGALLNESKKTDNSVFIYDKLYLISLNKTRDALEKTFITDVNEGSWYHVRFEFNNDTDKFRCSVNGTPVQTGQGEWTDVASDTCGDYGSVGTAEPYDFGAVDKIQFGICWSNWWQSLYFDNIKAAPAEYAINSDITGGTAAYTRGKQAAQTAAGGNRVTMRLSGDSGLALKSLSVEKKTGGEVSVTKLSDESCSFIMPREEVTVHAVYSDGSEPREWGINEITFDKDSGAFSFNVAKGEAAYDNLKIYTALYAGDVLRAVKIYDEPITDEITHITGKFDEADENIDTSIKIFMWYDGMIPVVN